MTAAGYVMIREATEDAILNVPNGDGKPGMRQVTIPKGLPVIVDVVGVRESIHANVKIYRHAYWRSSEYNPRYFPDPYKYDPHRWRGVTAESEELTAFSFGACPIHIGRPFDETHFPPRSSHLHWAQVLDRGSGLFPHGSCERLDHRAGDESRGDGRTMARASHAGRCGVDAHCETLASAVETEDEGCASCVTKSCNGSAAGPYL